LRIIAHSIGDGGTMARTMACFVVVVWPPGGTHTGYHTASMSGCHHGSPPPTISLEFGVVF